MVDAVIARLKEGGMDSLRNIILVVADATGQLSIFNSYNNNNFLDCPQYRGKFTFYNIYHLSNYLMQVFNVANWRRSAIANKPKSFSPPLSEVWNLFISRSSSISLKAKTGDRGKYPEKTVIGALNLNIDNRITAGFFCFC